MPDAKNNSLQKYITLGPENSNDAGTEFKQVSFDEELLKNFEFDQWRGLDYAYEIEPQSQNLFYAGYFCEAGDGTDTKSMKMFYNASYRIKKITIPFPSMELEYHPETRVPLVKSVSYTNEITIDWFEDVYHSVQKYHLDWFNRWYSREYDCFRCGIQGKFRKMAVIAFHYINTYENLIIPVPKMQPLFAFIIGGLIPKTLPSMTFDYGADQNDQLLSMTYNCGPIRWIYSDKIGQGDRSNQDEIDALFQNDAGASKAAADSIVNGPKYNSFDTHDEVDWEKLRIIRAATYYQASEGSI
jgi:hypothetical protein